MNTLPKQIIDIFNDFTKENNEDYNKIWEISGWVRDLRIQTNMAFMTLYDGSCYNNLQIIINKDNIPDIFNSLENLRGGCITIIGNIIKSPAKEQLLEMQCTNIKNINIVTDKSSLLLAKKVQLDTLRHHQHIKSRFKSYQYIYKIRSTLLKNIHKFFEDNRFYNLDPNIITTSDCEGAGEAFTITTIDSLSNTNLEDKYKKDFFEKHAFLTVSSQLQLEALTSGLSRVYTLNPSFRAEKSKTKRHLACFTHLEWEIAFIDINQLMDFSENLLKTIVSKTLQECHMEYSELNKFLSKGIQNKLKNIIDNDFKRISYCEAINIIQDNKNKILKKYKNEITLDMIPKWGDDLGSYCERFIAEEIYNKPIFVYNYPKDLKSFYMKLNDDNKTVQAVDLLLPNLGELIGSSIREENYDKLIKLMNDKNMDKSKLEWYTELRNNGTFFHGGAGLGFDRLVNFCTLMDGNIRDVVPFPVAYQECNY